MEKKAEILKQGPRGEEDMGEGGCVRVLEREQYRGCSGPFSSFEATQMSLKIKLGKEEIVLKYLESSQQCMEAKETYFLFHFCHMLGNEIFIQSLLVYFHVGKT